MWALGALLGVLLLGSVGGTWKPTRVCSPRDARESLCACLRVYENRRVHAAVSDSSPSPPLAYLALVPVRKLN